MSSLSLDGEALRVQLTTQNYALIEHGISADAINEGIAAYAEFTDNLPDPEPATLHAMMLNPNELDVLQRGADTQKEWHKYRTNHAQFAKPGGYTNRWLQAEVLRAYGRKILDKKTGEMVDPFEDPKEYFHIHPNGLARMNSLAAEFGWGPLPPEVVDLQAKWANIHHLAFEAMTNVLYLIEETHPELTTRFATPKDITGSPIRINWYYPGHGDILAGGHTDKGIGTIQVAESHLGFRGRVPACDTAEHIVRYNEDPLTDPNMRLLERNAELGIFFAATAIKNEAAYPNSELQPLWHDVIYSPKFNDQRMVIGKKCGRWSVIAFANSEAAGEVTKAQTHNEAITAVA